MPKTIRTASELLEKESALKADSVPEVSPIATPAEPASAVPPAGFEQPPVIPPEAPKHVFEPKPEKKVEAPAIAPAPAGLKQHRFVKNIHTEETIRLPDGSTYRFKSAVLVTHDAKLASQLTQVAARYNILPE